MVRVKCVAAAFALSASWTASALAADLGGTGGSFKDLPVPEEYRWSGFLVGVGIGGGVAQYSGGVDGVFDVDPSSPDTFDVLSSSAGADQAFLFGTVQVGYDLQFLPQWVAGVFADYDFSNSPDSHFGNTTLLTSGGTGAVASVQGTTEVDNSWSVGGRLGFLANPTLLVYALAAWTHTDFEINGTVSSSVGGGAPVSFSESDTLDGLTVGGGVEAMIIRGLTLKFEYRFTDLNTLNDNTVLTGLAGGTSDGEGREHLDTDLHTARVVLSWRPGM